VPAAALVVLALANRALRLQGERSLRERGVPTRVVSRPAELAKALADGAATHVFVGVTVEDETLAALVRASVPVVRVADGEGLERALNALVPLTP
jgi:hypothetical protein